MQAQGLGGDLGGDEGVAVAVAADPGGQAQPGALAALAEAGELDGGVVAGQGGLEELIGARDGAPEDLSDEVQVRADLIGDGRPRGCGRGRSARAR